MFRVWIGNRESEISTYSTFFDASITFYGDNTGGNSAFSIVQREPTNYAKGFSDFVVSAMNAFVDKYSDIEFHFYNQHFAHKIIRQEKGLGQYCANVNHSETLSWINSKIFTRLWLRNATSVPEFSLLSKQECAYDNLTKLFPDRSEFVIQKHISGGGEGTFLLTKETEITVLSELSNYSLYLVSPFYKKTYTICCHLLIYDNYVNVFPFGIQTSNHIDNKFIYEGSDYIAGQNLSNNLIRRLNNESKDIGKQLSAIGYRGICGFDYIVTDQDILFIEVNARYLGSTFLINATLYENNMPSIFDLNGDCFASTPRYQDFNAQKMIVNFKSKTHRNNADIMYAHDIKKAILEIPKSDTRILFLDGLDASESVEKNTYMCRELIAK